MEITRKIQKEIEFTSPEGRAAVEIVKAIREHSRGEAFIVGGAVRDALLGQEPKDVDVATSLTPKEVMEVFGTYRVKLVGKSFGVALVARNGENIEVATFRKDGTYTDGRRPDSVEFSRHAEDDSMRRDLTINALYFDPVDNKIVDFHGGLEDLACGLVRTVGKPEQRFSEDFLRMLRAVRFASRLGFRIEGNTGDAIRDMAHNIENISGERIFMELEKMLVKSPVHAVKLMRDLNLLEHILPEVLAMQGVEQPPHHHPEGDVFVHTMLVLESMEKVTEKITPELAFACILHDIGKPLTKGINKKGDICFHGHSEVGKNMAEEILKERFRCSNKFTEDVCTIIAHHSHIAFSSKAKISKIRRHMARPTIDLELEFCRLDAMGKGSACDLTNYNRLMELRKRFRNEPAIPERLLSGQDIIAAGVPRGPEIGRLMREIQTLQMEGDISTKEEAISFVKRSL